MTFGEPLSACPLCTRQFQSPINLDSNRYHIMCPICGRYDIGFLVTCNDAITDYAKPLLSAVVRRHFEFTKSPELITQDNWEALISQAPEKNDIPGKVRYLLRYVAHKSQFPGEKIGLNRETDYAVCFAANPSEFDFYIQYIKDAGFLSGAPALGSPADAPVYCLTTKGWEETKRIPTLDSPYAFVAMSFTKEGERGALLARAFKDAIQPAIENDAGYEKAIRIDKEEFLGDIVFEIIARIKECRFMVADFTEQKNGVYFEAGYAMGMGLPVIWLCHKDDIKKAHFDTNHMNHIVWDDLGELRKNLANRILATIGPGPKRATRATR